MLRNTKFLDWTSVNFISIYYQCSVTTTLMLWIPLHARPPFVFSCAPPSFPAGKIMKTRPEDLTWKQERRRRCVCVGGGGEREGGTHTRTHARRKRGGKELSRDSYPAGNGSWRFPGMTCMHMHICIYSIPTYSSAYTRYFSV